MNRTIRAGWLSCAIGLGLAGAGLACAPAVAKAPMVADRLDQGLFSAAVVAEVNCMRERQGLAALRADPKLARVSGSHSGWMAKTGRMEHVSTLAGLTDLKARMRKAGYRAAGAENIGQTSRFPVAGACGASAGASYADLATRAMQLWMDSSGHRANILKRDVAQAGAGLAVATGGAKCGTVYFTLILAR